MDMFWRGLPTHLLHHSNCITLSIIFTHPLTTLVVSGNQFLIRPTHPGSGSSHLLLPPPPGYVLLYCSLQCMRSYELLVCCVVYVCIHAYVCVRCVYVYWHAGNHADAYFWFTHVSCDATFQLYPHKFIAWLAICTLVFTHFFIRIHISGWASKILNFSLLFLKFPAL